MSTQTILGYGGVIGKELIKHLPDYCDTVRLVSRSGRKADGNFEVVTADLLDKSQVNNAVKGSEIVYLTAGLQYNHKIWAEQWPKIMTNTIEACKQHNAKLVFFDNVYMYGKVDGPMTEETPYNPCSKKGEIRAKIATQLMNEAKAGNLQALIARAADFYGPGSDLSVVNVMTLKPMQNGKKPNWIGNAKLKHSFSYTPDCGKATALLGNTDDAFGQIWHLPTDKNALTGEQFIQIAAEKLGVAPKYNVMGKFMLSIAGLFMEPVRESIEMLYQNEYEYLFESSKFEGKFFSATPYEEGIAATVASAK